MKSRSVLLYLFFSLSASLWGGHEFLLGPGERAVARQFLVHFKPGVTPDSVLKGIAPGAQSVPVLHNNVHLITLPPGAAAGLSAQIANHPGVHFVEPNRIRHSTVIAPNDPSYFQQYALGLVQAVQAWSVIPGRYLTAAAAGANRPIVAILDTGADCTHPDFKNAGGISTDSALGGQLSFAASRAFVATTIASPACPWLDDYGHGTHVAGTIAAATNNGVGVAGLAYPVQLMIYKVLDVRGEGDDALIASGIQAAADAGANIISLSLGGAGYSQTLQSAANYAWQRNTLVVAAAGNNNSSALFFPAGANYVMGVAATDTADQKASFSNFGADVDIAAPGVSILSTMPSYPGTTLSTQNYGTLSGTSMATPHVAALAGLIALQNPNLAAASIAQRIQQSADSSFLNGGWDQNLGYGRINAARALSGNLRPATAGGVVGQVVDGAALPQTGAVVTVTGQSFTTDTSGLFRFSNLSTGFYSVVASASGFPIQSRLTYVAPGADTTVTFVMGSSLGTFTGTVTSGGTPVAGAAVQALQGGLVQATAISASDGSYSMPVAPGVYDLRGSAPSKITNTVPAQTVATAANTIVNIPLGAFGSIAGTITDSSSTPLVNVAVSVVGGSFSAGAITDGSGHYSTSGVPAGTYAVTASAPGFQPSTLGSVTVGAGAVAPANFQLGGFTAIRVNAGGAVYTDPQGNVWSADTGYSAGLSSSTTSSIAGTTTPVLYQTLHYSTGAFQYQFAVSNGNYTVNLKFAEIFWTTGGHRIFNVVLNGQTVLPNFDPAQVGGAFTAVDRQFPVTVTNGQITIQLTPVADTPTINAIEILAPPAPLTFTPIRVNAGGGAFTDPQGNLWSADTGFDTGASYSDPRPIAGTNAPYLYQTEHYSTGPFQYRFNVPNGNYTVNLKFAEIYWTTGGRRIFNVILNGQTVLPNFDPAQVAGAFTAVDRQFPVTVNGGQIVVQLTPVADLPTISAIEILPPQTQPPAFTAIRVNAGGGSYTDPQGNIWGSDTGFSGGFSFSTTSPIAGTSTPALYQTEHYSTGPFQYSFTAPNGNYTVNLKFAEIYFTSGGHRIFNVALNGQTVLPNFDPAQVGGAFTAVDRQFPVTVTTGQIVIQLTPVADLPTISAIEILPATTFTPVRVNAGGPAYTDVQGNVWGADTGFSAGLSFSTSSPIAGTNTPVLYQTEHYSTGPFQYQVNAPNGDYTVNLKFAEIYFTSGGHRIFNVAINGLTVLSNFDPAQAGGAFTAIDRQFPVTVTTGQIVILLTPVADLPTISAIEILPAQTQPPAFTPIRVNAGGGLYVDSQGKTWTADTGASTGSSFSTTSAIAGTTAPALYQTEHYSTGPFQYQFFAPNGNYTVNLKFAEIYFTSGGHRIFNVAINGQTVLSNFDPAQAGGAFTAVDRAFPVTVTTGQIVIQLTPVADLPTISAIEIF